VPAALRGSWAPLASSVSIAGGLPGRRRSRGLGGGFGDNKTFLFVLFLVPIFSPFLYIFIIVSLNMLYYYIFIVFFHGSKEIQLSIPNFEKSFVLESSAPFSQPSDSTLLEIYLV
jgi:hypothetical protein